MRDDNDLYDPRSYEYEDFPAPCGPRHRSADTWDLARDAYLAGETAAQVCARFDLGLSAFWDRARREGWRRRDRSDPEPLPVDPDDDIDFDADYAELADHALRQLRRAMARGRASAAASWMRLHDRLTARAREQADAEEKAAKAASALKRAETLAVLKTVSDAATDIEALARRLADADPRDGVARAAIETELARLDAEIATVSRPDPNKPNNPNTFSTADGVPHPDP